MTEAAAGILVRAEEAEELSLPIGAMRLFAEGRSTNGAFSVIRATLQPGAEGARPHHHTSASEMFFVISGSVDVLVGNDVVRANAGDLAVVAPGSIHAFANASETDVLDLLIVFGPGIDRFDYFRLVRDVVAGERSGSEIVASQELFDNRFGESAAWTAHLAEIRGRRANR
jgi:mannose-6-phosphate isomerase-like protein (cupin superfamily)